MDILDTIKSLFELTQNSRCQIATYKAVPGTGEIDHFTSFNVGAGEMRFEVSRVSYGGILMYMVHARCAQGSLLLNVDGNWRNISPFDDLAGTIADVLQALLTQTKNELLTALHEELNATNCMHNTRLQPKQKPRQPIDSLITFGRLEVLL